MAKKKQKRDLIALWQGRVRKVIAQSSDDEVRVLLNLIWHKEMTTEQKYLVFDRAIFDVWSEREADRQEEAKVRRTRAREQAKQERSLSVEERMHPRYEDSGPASERMEGRPSSQPPIEHDSASPDK